MQFSKQELQAAQDIYIQSRDPKDLDKLYTLAKEAARVYVISYTRSIGYRIHPDRVPEVCHDATTRMIEAHLKYPDKAAMPIAERLWNEILYQIHNPTVARYEQRVGTLEDYDPGISIPEPEMTDPMGYLREIVTDTGVQGRRIVFTLFSNKHYRTAIKAIACYTPRQWIYENAVKLHIIYKMTRGKL